MKSSRSPSSPPSRERRNLTPADFAGAGLRQRTNENHRFRCAEVLQMGCAILQHIHFGELGSVAECYNRPDCLSKHFVRNTDDRSLRHSWNRMKDIFNLSWTYFLSPCLDNVVLAANEIQVPFLVHPEQVPGVKHHLVWQRS